MRPIQIQLQENQHVSPGPSSPKTTMRGLMYIQLLSQVMYESFEMRFVTTAESLPPISSEILDILQSPIWNWVLVAKSFEVELEMGKPWSKCQAGELTVLKYSPNGQLIRTSVSSANTGLGLYFRGGGNSRANRKTRHRIWTSAILSWRQSQWMTRCAIQMPSHLR